jgi:hypothetical protein
MSLPLPAGPDHPLVMPPDGILDRTHEVITDRPRPAEEVDESPASGETPASPPTPEAQEPPTAAGS